MDHITQTKVQRTGGCKGTHLIRIPKPICDKLKIKKGDLMDVFLDLETVVYSKSKEFVHATVVERDEAVGLK